MVVGQSSSAKQLAEYNRKALQTTSSSLVISIQIMLLTGTTPRKEKKELKSLKIYALGQNSSWPRLSWSKITFRSYIIWSKHPATLCSDKI